MMDAEKFEQDIVSALLEAGSWRKDNVIREVQIVRDEQIKFSFKVESLTEDEWRKCRRQNTNNKGRRTEELDESRFLSQIIYEATVEEDKQRLWRNREVWKKLGVASGIDVVNQILKPAEKAKIVEVISNISGYDDEENLDEMIKN